MSQTIARPKKSAPALPHFKQSSESELTILRKLEAELRALDEYNRSNRLSFYAPYAKQREFHANGRTHRERLLMGANKSGKSVCGGAEVAVHVTGLYPDWWTGARYPRATRWWAASLTAEATRDNVQATLVGPPERETEFGTGYIPKSRLLDWSRAMGTPNLLDHVTVRHVSGDVSTIGFKSYSQGREKWQGPKLDGVWFDEEPDVDIYMEGITRTNATEDARVFLTFTPLLGMSDVVRMFLIEDAP